MKRIIQKLALFSALMAVWLAGPVPGAYGQDTIVYFSEPSFRFQAEPSEPDLWWSVGDSLAFSFRFGPFLCTADVPTSGCSAPYYVVGFGTNAILRRSSQAAMLPFGAWIDSLPPTNSTWSDQGQSASVATYYFSPRYNTSGMSGPLIDVGVGYLGIRFYLADGLHYGWVRLRSAPIVAVVDWAYEGRPNTPIRAGVIGSGGESLQFTVNFQGPNNTLAHAGTFILTGASLRGELTLAGLFSSADIAGPAPARARVKPFASLGQPLARRTDFTSFLGEATLSHAEIIHLLRGADHVWVDGGVVQGRILSIAEER